MERVDVHIFDLEGGEKFLERLTALWKGHENVKSLSIHIAAIAPPEPCTGTELGEFFNYLAAFKELKSFRIRLSDGLKKRMEGMKLDINAGERAVLQINCR